ncbi:MAG: four helix bundle protein [Planctomycetes bacterium]|nr:four helix bundle protein [Planctomycetota bacterium]
MPTIRKFEDLEAWKFARQLCRSIYSASKTGMLARDFALRDQLRRAAISVMSSIAEGFERDGSGEFLHFLAIAKGSVGEIHSQLYIALDQGYLSEEQYSTIKEQADKTGRLMAGLMRYLKSTDIRGQKYLKQSAYYGTPPARGAPAPTPASKAKNKKPGTRN